MTLNYFVIYVTIFCEIVLTQLKYFTKIHLIESESQISELDGGVAYQFNLANALKYEEIQINIQIIEGSSDLENTMNSFIVDGDIQNYVISEIYFSEFEGELVHLPLYLISRGRSKIRITPFVFRNDHETDRLFSQILPIEIGNIEYGELQKYHVVRYAFSSLQSAGDSNTITLTISYQETENEMGDQNPPQINLFCKDYKQNAEKKCHYSKLNYYKSNGKNIGIEIQDAKGEFLLELTPEIGESQNVSISYEISIYDHKHDYELIGSRKGFYLGSSSVLEISNLIQKDKSNENIFEILQCEGELEIVSDNQQNVSFRKLGKSIFIFDSEIQSGHIFKAHQQPSFFFIKKITQDNAILDAINSSLEFSVKVIDQFNLLVSILPITLNQDKVSAELFPIIDYQVYQYKSQEELESNSKCSKYFHQTEEDSIPKVYSSISKLCTNQNDPIEFTLKIDRGNFIQVQAFLSTTDKNNKKQAIIFTERSIQ